MSKLPVVSGAECVKALGKIGFVVYRQRGSHVTLIRKHRPPKRPFPTTKNWIGERYAQSFDQPD
jgi:HicA toxin of bacterial toxin-antitoxin,